MSPALGTRRKAQSTATMVLACLVAYVCPGAYHIFTLSPTIVSFAPDQGSTGALGSSQTRLGCPSDVVVYQSECIITQASKLPPTGCRSPILSCEFASQTSAQVCFIQLALFPRSQTSCCYSTTASVWCNRKPLSSSINTCIQNFLLLTWL